MATVRQRYVRTGYMYVYADTEYNETGGYSHTCMHNKYQTGPYITVYIYIYMYI